MSCLICPDLLPADKQDLAPGPEAHAGAAILSLKSLARAKRRASHSDDNRVPRQTPVEDWLSKAFQMPADCHTGAFARFTPGQDHDKEDADQSTLVVTPASLHATMDHLVLQDPAMLNICADEARQLTDKANEFWVQDGISLEPIRPDCWLLRRSATWALDLHGSAVATGRNVDAYMPAGPDGRRLRALLNELQMLWHDHPINQARMDQGIAPINALWVEGLARPFDGRPHPFAAVRSDRAAARGLALASGLPPELVGPTGTPTYVGTNELIELGTGTSPATLEQWLSPRTQSPVRVVLTNARSWVELALTPADRFKFWRRSPLAP